MWTSTSLLTGIAAGAVMVNCAAITACTGAPVAPASGPIVILFSVIGMSTTPSSAYTPFRKSADAISVTSKSTVNAAPGATGFADGVDTILYCNGNF
jgi:hypothetical protein